VLSEAERARAARLHDSSERRLFELGRGCLRTILAGYTGTTAKEIVLSTRCRHCHASEHGKPLIASPTDAPLDFNASRAGRVLAVAVAAGVSVGIDIEFLSRTSDWEAIAPLLLSSAERRELGLFPRVARSKAVLCSWVCKEALLKATGHGLWVDPRTVVLSQRPDGPPIVLTPPPGTQTSAWSICPFTTGRDGLIAVAVLGHVAGLTLRGPCRVTAAQDGFGLTGDAL
jgi:4'-phosphopantetheinyl transferase